jgi:hypothetical protein
LECYSISGFVKPETQHHTVWLWSAPSASASGSAGAAFGSIDSDELPIATSDTACRRLGRRADVSTAQASRRRARTWMTSWITCDDHMATSREASHRRLPMTSSPCYVATSASSATASRRTSLRLSRSSAVAECHWLPSSAAATWSRHQLASNSASPFSRGVPTARRPRAFSRGGTPARRRRGAAATAASSSRTSTPAGHRSGCTCAQPGRAARWPPPGTSEMLMFVPDQFHDMLLLVPSMPCISAP